MWWSCSRYSNMKKTRKSKALIYAVGVAVHGTRPLIYVTNATRFEPNSNVDGKTLLTFLNTRTEPNKTGTFNVILPLASHATAAQVERLVIAPAMSRAIATRIRVSLVHRVRKASAAGDPRWSPTRNRKRRRWAAYQKRRRRWKTGCEGRNPIDV